MLLFWMRGRPRVLTVHNLAGHESKKLYGWVTSRLISLASAVITHLEHPPQWFIDECQRRTGQPPLFVPHGPLDLYRQVERSPAQPILPPGAVGVLFFGAIRPYKGLDHLIEAFDAVHQAISSAWLVIAGRPWEPWQRYQTLIDQKPWCQQVITRLDYIPTDEVAGYFNACQLVVAPYLEFDSQSGAALSAIGMEKPLIVTRVGGLPELQPLAEYVVPPADSNALASAIIRALQKPRELARLSAAARFVARESSWTLIQEKTEMIYRTLLPSEKPKP
jgi:glycosyltransferase involved in cell wall biosynthesis